MEFFVAALCGALDQVEQALVPPSTKPSLADIHFLNPIQNGTWEDEVPEAEFIHWAVRAGDNVLEIGANIGRSSIVAASCSQPGGSVVSSEADPERLLLAKANAANAENVRFVPAISASDLYLPISSLHAASLYLLERLRLLENLGLLWLRAFLLSGLRLSCREI